MALGLWRGRGRREFARPENRQRLPGEMGRGEPRHETVTPQSRSNTATRAKTDLANSHDRRRAAQLDESAPPSALLRFPKRRNFDDAEAGTDKSVGSVMWPIAAEAFRTLPRHTNTPADAISRPGPRWGSRPRGPGYARPRERTPRRGGRPCLERTTRRPNPARRRCHGSAPP